MVTARKLIIHILRTLWIFTFIYNEYFIFIKYAHQLSIQLNKIDKHILLIADPQITDNLSYDRPWILLQITKFYSDLYMKRNYKHLVNTIHPYQVVIMGDLMDNGREWDDEYFQKELKRFNKIFQRKDVSPYFMVGNHDIGFGDGIEPRLLERFQKYFGQTSYVVQHTNYNFFILDTVSLSSSIPQIRDDALSMLQKYPASNNKTTILFSHVPLYRQPDTSCGPFRQTTQTIRNGYGYQYQNLISKDLSDLILDTVRPSLVFSADDHDYCEVIHRETIKEITVPTFSMSQGVRYPGLVVLSMSDQASTVLHWLPSQIDIFILYACLLGLSIISIIAVEVIQMKQHNYIKIQSSELPTTTGDRYKKPLGVLFISILKNIRDVALIAVVTYVFCLLCL